MTTKWGVFAIAGPKSRDVLRALIRDADPVDGTVEQAVPLALACGDIELGMCPVMAVRVAYTGELGWELHHPIEMQNYLWDRLMEAGEAARADAGGRAGAELAAAGESPIAPLAPNWAGMRRRWRRGWTRFVDLSKDFRGKAAMEALGVRSLCVTLLIDGPADADPWGREALYLGDEKVGRLTSGGYSVAFGKSIGMGYVRPDLAVPGTRLQVKMFDRLWDAEITQDSPYDPKNARIRVDLGA